MGVQRIAIMLLIALVGPQMGAQRGASKPDRFATLRFLAGTWRGDQAGQPRTWHGRTHLPVHPQRSVSAGNEHVDLSAAGEEQER